MCDLVRKIIVAFMLVFVARTTWTLNTTTVLCPGVSNCRCEPNSNKTDIRCENVDSLNDIQNLIRTHFKNKGIHKLNLDPCSVKVIPKDFFSNASISQFFSTCPLEHIEENAFANVRDLLKIMLDKPSFSDIPIGLRYAPGVKSLYSRNGFLESLDDELRNLTDLSYLIIKFNFIRVISKDTFIHTPGLGHLDLSFNKLRFIPEGTFDPLTMLRKIVLAGNNLITLNGAFRKLDPVDVDLSFNDLTVVTDAFRDKSANIKILKIQGNPLEYEKLLSLGQKATSVTTLDISRCEFGELDGRFLFQFPFLKQLYAGSNQLRKLPKDLFRHLRALMEVDLSYNKLESVEGVFNGLSYLRTLDLDGNKLKTTRNSFSNITSLRELFLSDNKITALNKGDFAGLWRLERLQLNSNKIMHLDKDCFSGLTHLESLHLNYNGFDTLNESISHLGTLTKFVIIGGRLVRVSETDLSSLRNIRNLDLRSHQLIDVNGAFRGLHSLKSLELAKNKLRTLSEDSFPEDMKITRLTLGGGNHWVCDCRLLWLLKWYHRTKGKYLKDKPLCHYPRPRLHSKPFTNLTEEDLTNWYEDCPESCTCYCRPDGRDYYVEVDCTNQDMNELPDRLPEKAGTLFMNNNSLTKIRFDNTTSAVQNLRVLNVSNNNIEELDGQLPEALEVLNLDGNKLKRFPGNLYDKTFNQLTLAGNPWICDCDTRDFRKWLLSLGDVVIDVNDTRCHEDRQKGVLIGEIITSLTDNDLCPSKVKTYVAIALGTLSLLFVCSSFGLAYFRYKLNLKVWLYSHGFTWVKEDENDDRIFDALLCCNDEDLEFALNEIVYGLENEQPHFTVCVPDRDILLGGNEIVDILTAVSQCRRVIIILSKAFMQDEFRMEVFRSAFAVFLEEKIRRIIVIQYGELQSKNDMDPSLKAMLESSDTLRWKEKTFWSKLRYAMRVTIFLIANPWSAQEKGVGDFVCAIIVTFQEHQASRIQPGVYGHLVVIAEERKERFR